MTETLRPAQEQILRYEGGKLAVSAVPGAGKTFILTHLAARLVEDLHVPPRRILILTFMRSAAATFRQRIALALSERGLSAYGLQAMTFHAFCLGIIQRARATRGAVWDGEEALQVVSDREKELVLQECLQPLLADHARWNLTVERYGETARDPAKRFRDDCQRIISAAKHLGLDPDAVDAALAGDLAEFAVVNRAYRDRLHQLRALDFDDQVREAAHLLRSDPVLLRDLQDRYTHVLEDEAQDSSPAQHALIELLTEPRWGGAGNLVRVGDSNQAILTTFTFNEPRFFREYCEALVAQDRHVPMDESSRSAEPVLRLANGLIDFAAAHPDRAVAQAFTGGHIKPATAGKKNPEAWGEPTFIVYDSPDLERSAVLTQVERFLERHPEATAAVLLGMRQDVQDYADAARTRGIPIVEMERTDVSTSKVLSVLEHLLALVARPGEAHHAAMIDLVKTMPPALPREHKLPELQAYLKGTDLEALVFPPHGLPPARPSSVSEEDYARLVWVAGRVREVFDGRHLPPEELLPQAAEAFFGDLFAPAIASRALRAARAHAERLLAPPDNPWASLELALRTLKTAGGELLKAERPEASPTPGHVQIMTMHKSKGAEFTAVWLPALGYKGGFFPWDLARTSIRDLAAKEAERRLRAAATGTAIATGDLDREARQDLVAERLRLLYVGITRAERALHLSCSQVRSGPPAAEHVMHLADLCRSKELAR